MTPQTSLTTLLTENPYKTTLILTTTLALPFLISTYLDYRHYVSLGPHGLPDTAWGYYRQLRMRSVAAPLSSTTIPAPYDLTTASAALGPNALQSFLPPLSHRSGTRPEICPFVAPQRQESQTATEVMKQRMNTYLDTLVSSNPSLYQRELSNLEGPVPAIQVLAHLHPPPCLKPTRGELIHIHPPDGSTHVVASLADSKTIIEKEWGQRHRLSAKMLDWGYTLIYAPRDDDEFEVWKGIMGAVAKFVGMEMGVDVKIP
ncbi:hypothetical protein GGR57DRAFT_468434 [Xylariaceae sp. FL1272]|nr:hypothetical protein GGR57DRAFT_468434 [Xylariaceae sp. FL1272]